MTEQKETTKSILLKKLIAGFVIGVGAIIPGVSGSVLAVALGIYKKMIDAIASFFKAPKASILYLLPIGLGLLVGVLSMSNAVEWLMLNWRTQLVFLFIGLVLGGVPLILKEGNRDSGFRPRYLIAAAVGFAVVLLVSIAEGGAAEPVARGEVTLLQALLSGGVIAAGAVIPGLSVSFVLIHMGVYEALMAALNSFDMPVLVCMGIGFVAVALLVVKAVKWVFDRHSGYAYYAVLGLSLAFVIMNIPPISANITLLWNILLLAGGFLASYRMDRLSST